MGLCFPNITLRRKRAKKTRKKRVLFRKAISGKSFLRRVVDGDEEFRLKKKRELIEDALEYPEVFCIHLADQSVCKVVTTLQGATEETWMPDGFPVPVLLP